MVSPPLTDGLVPAGDGSWWSSCVGGCVRQRGQVRVDAGVLGGIQVVVHHRPAAPQDDRR
jgi:hypothetical protein